MKNLFKRTLAFLLVLMLLITMIPGNSVSNLAPLYKDFGNAFADDTNQDDILYVKLPESNPFVSGEYPEEITLDGYIYRGYSIGKVTNGLTTESFNVDLYANISELSGTDTENRKIVITVPNGFSIKAWSTDITDILDKGKSKYLSVKPEEDGSKKYVLAIKNDLSPTEISQLTPISQDAVTIFNDYKIGKEYTFKIEYYLGEVLKKSSTMKLIPEQQNEATWEVTANLNNVVYTVDNERTGPSREDGTLDAYAINSYYPTTYAIVGTGSAGAGLKSNYQGYANLGRYFYYSTSTEYSGGTNNIKGASPNVIIRNTENTEGYYKYGWPTYPTLDKTATVSLRKTEGYVGRNAIIEIPLPKYVDGNNNASLELFKWKDGTSSINTLYTEVWFKPDDDIYAYKIPYGNVSYSMFSFIYDAENEIVKLDINPKKYLKPGTYKYKVNNDLSFMDLFAKPGTFYVYLSMTADLTKLINKDFLGEYSDIESIGEIHSIKADDKVSITYDDMSKDANVGDITKVNSAEALTLNFKGSSTPDINFTSYVTQIERKVKEQTFNTLSKPIVESVALSSIDKGDPLANVGQLNGKGTLGRGQTNIYFEYTYTQAFSPVTLENLFNGIYPSQKTISAQNSKYIVTVTNAKTKAKKEIVIDENWVVDGVFSNIATAEQLGLDDENYISKIRVDNPIAWVSGSSFSSTSENAWGIFTATYKSNKNVYNDSGVIVKLVNDHEAKITVKYGSDQVSEKKDERIVTLKDAKNNFDIRTMVYSFYDYGKIYKYAIPVNNNESIYTLYGFYIRKYQDTMQYEEDKYPIITLSGSGVELSDVVMIDIPKVNGISVVNYYRPAFVPISYINDNDEEIVFSDEGYDLLADYYLGTEIKPNTYAENRIYSSTTTAVGYDLSEIFAKHGYAKEIRFEYRPNEINNYSAISGKKYQVSDMKIWLGCKKLKPGYLNFDNLIDETKLAKDYRAITPNNYYVVNISVDDSKVGAEYSAKCTEYNITDTTAHIQNKIFNKTFSVVYGLKNDAIVVKELDHYIDPIGASWKGTDYDGKNGGFGNSVVSGILYNNRNVPYNDATRNEQTALAQIEFEAQYRSNNNTLDKIVGGNKDINKLSPMGVFDYVDMCFDFAGTDEDILALTNGIAISSDKDYLRVEDVKIAYKTNLNFTEKIETLPLRGGTQYKYGDGYVYFDLRKYLNEENKEYFTSIKLIMPDDWTEILNSNIRYGVDIFEGETSTLYSKNRGLPNIRLVRIGNLPKNYPVTKKPIGNKLDSFKSEDWEKLPVTCKLTYTDVFGNEMTSEANGESSRIKGQIMYVINIREAGQIRYYNTVTGPGVADGSTYQGGKIKWDNVLYFEYKDGGQIDPERKIRPILYYEIDKSYRPDLSSINVIITEDNRRVTLTNEDITIRYIEAGVATSGSDEYGTLIIDLKNTNGVEQKYNNKFTVLGNLFINYDAAINSYEPIRRVWADIPYDRDLNNLELANEQNDYSMLIADEKSGGVRNTEMITSNYNNSLLDDYPAQFVDDKNAMMLKIDFNKTWNVLTASTAGASCSAQSREPGEIGQSVSTWDLLDATGEGNNDPSKYLFKTNVNLKAPTYETENWNVYIPVPKQDKNGKPFLLKPIDVDIASLKKLADVKILYTTEEDYSTDSSDDEEDTYKVWDKALITEDEINKITCIKIVINNLEAGSRGLISCSYQLIERKSEIGVQTAEQHMAGRYYHNNKAYELFLEGESEESKNILEFILKDIEISGIAWSEEGNNYDSTLGDTDRRMQNVNINATIVGTDNSYSVKTNYFGVYKLTVPREDNYVLSAHVGEGYMLVNKLVSGMQSNRSKESWFNRDTKKTDELLVKRAGLSGVGIGINKLPIINCTPENMYIHVGETSNNIVKIKFPSPGATAEAKASEGAGFEVNKVSNNTFSVKGITTGVYDMYVTASDGYGGEITKTAKITVFSKVKYNANGGQGAVPVDDIEYYPYVDENGVSFNKDLVTVKEPNLVKEGHSFVGWSETPTIVTGSAIYAKGLVDKKETFNIGVRYGDVDLYAQWEPIRYNIVFDKNDMSVNGKDLLGNVEGTVDSIIDVIYGNEVTLLKNTYSIPGYTFIGWNTAKDGSGISYADKQSVLNINVEGQKDTILYAQWEPHKYTVKYHKNHSDATGVTAESQHVYGEDKELTANGYTNGDYVFDYWSKKEKPDEDDQRYYDRALVNNLTTENDGVVDLYAIWGNKAITIIFDKNNISTRMKALRSEPIGEMSNMAHIMPETEYDLSSNQYTIEGYIFIGWNSKSNGQGRTYLDEERIINVPANEPNYILRLYAQWEPIKYSISYIGNGSSELDTQDKVIGSMEPSIHEYDATYKISKNIFVRNGYKFVGWNTAKDGSGLSYSDSQEIKDLTLIDGYNIKLYAMWEKVEKLDVEVPEDPTNPPKSKEQGDDGKTSDSEKPKDPTNPPKSKEQGDDGKTSDSEKPKDKYVTKDDGPTIDEIEESIGTITDDGHIIHKETGEKIKLETGATFEINRRGNNEFWTIVDIEDELLPSGGIQYNLSWSKSDGKETTAKSALPSTGGVTSGLIYGLGILSIISGALVGKPRRNKKTR